jgi:hypothetical protein
MGLRFRDSKVAFMRICTDAETARREVGLEG